MNFILYSYKKTLLGCPGGLAGKTRGNGNINGLVFPLSLPFLTFQLFTVFKAAMAKF